jgi:uncharacterized protein (TIGR04255 family)
MSADESAGKNRTPCPHKNNYVLVQGLVHFEIRHVPVCNKMKRNQEPIAIVAKRPKSKSEKRSLFGAVTATVTDKLRRPAIVEAVCELRFGAGVSYTLVPGAMRERLRSTYPDFEVLPQATILSALPEEAMPSVPHHRFRRSNPNLLVQTGPRLLTINVLAPYPSFEIYRKEIIDVLEKYKAIANPGPPGRVGLRYINQLHSPDQNPDDITTYLRCSFSYPQELEHPPSELASRVLLSYGKFGTLALAVAFPSRTADGETAATLDMDFYWNERGNQFDLSEFPNWLQAAHDIIYRAFTSTVAEALLAKMR